MLIAICSIFAVLVAVALLFPFYVHGDFSADLKEGFLKLSFLRWQHEFKHQWKDDEESFEATETAPKEPVEKKEAKVAEKPRCVTESSVEPQKEKSEEPSIGSTVTQANTDTPEEPKVMQEARRNVKRKRKKVQEEKSEESELSDRDFFTLVLQPRMVSLAWKYLKKLLAATFKLFHFRFFDSYIEGINTGNPARNGYLTAAFAGLQSVLPALAGFIFAIDWTGSLKPCIYGKFTAEINLLRTIVYLLIVAYIIARVALLYFWMRYRYKKDPVPFKLSWWRKKIVDFIAAED